jgi:hypothetical protein
MMKKSLFVTLLCLTTLVTPAISQAGFLDEIEGRYKIGGKKCRFESSTRPTGRARISSIEKGATVDIEVIIASLKTTIPFSFKSGSGDVKTTRMEGDIIKLPIVRRTVWSTDEKERKSVITQFEGVAIPRLLSTSTLQEKSSRELIIKIEDKESSIIECELVKE